MRMDDENKVVVPDFVAEWIEYNINEGVSLEIMMGCYRSFLNSEEERVTDGSRAVEWFVKNPYEFVRAYVEGFAVEVSEPDKKYYWRKKKEHLAWFETGNTSYLNVRYEDELILSDTFVTENYKAEFTESEAHDLLKDDFDKFEKVECE